MHNKKRDLKTAIALSYDSKDEAPRVIATGRNILAEKIIKTAKEHHIPIHQDEHIAKSLSSLELGAFIPGELYEVVAEILIFVDSMDNIKNKLL